MTRGAHAAHITEAKMKSRRTKRMQRDVAVVPIVRGGRRMGGFAESQLLAGEVPLMHFVLRLGDAGPSTGDDRPEVSAR